MLAVIRGAGDIASAIALRLVRCGASVLMTEIEQPLTVRRTVAFSEAVRMGKAQVEGVTAVRARDASHALELLSGEGVVPVLVVWIFFGGNIFFASISICLSCVLYSCLQI